MGSEVHIDIYDDRLTIYSPGGMADGTRIQERDIENVSSTWRNPILADIFGRLGYMERQGSGFKKITDAYYVAHNFRAELEPKFYSDVTSFQVTLYNLNYGTNEKWTVEDEKVAFGQNKVAFERSIFKIKINTPTKDKVLSLFDCFEYERAFSRSDLIQMFGMAPSSARFRVLFIRRTHSIWSEALSASDTPSRFAIAGMMRASLSLQDWSISDKCFPVCTAHLFK